MSPNEMEGDVKHDEERESNRLETASSPSSSRRDTQIETRRLLRKIDIRLLPICAAIYAFALIDRVNLPNARIAGAGEDLGLEIGNRYTITTLVFFLPYIFFEYPASLAIRRIGPAGWLGGLAVGFGVTTIGMGFVKSWGALAGCRVLLGTFEAGLYPGCVYLLGCWYVRYEVQKRFSAFYLLALLASGVGNILAYGLTQMEGVGGLRGWRWIFVLEGIVTAFLGLVAVGVLVATEPGLISKKPFLTDDEANFILARIEEDRGDSKVDKMTWRDAITYLSDWKIWEFAWIYLLAATVGYSFSLFLPIILEDELGYSTSHAQILAFPPFVAGAVYMFIVAFAGDHFRIRGVIVIINSVVALIGLVVVGFVSNPNARYAGTYLGVGGANANIPTIISLMHNNVVGQMKRSLATILLIGGSGISGIITATIFRQQDAPGYRPALATVIATQVVTILHVLKNFYVYSKANKRAERGEIVLERTPGFRYTL